MIVSGFEASFAAYIFTICKFYPQSLVLIKFSGHPKFLPFPMLQRERQDVEGALGGQDVPLQLPPGRRHGGRAAGRAAGRLHQPASTTDGRGAGGRGVQPASPRLDGPARGTA